jgi:cyclopropane fatty-acyl-phospholipid synthase-like methyltransferase
MARRSSHGLVTYYNERAHEYDDLYTGAMPTTDKPDLYTTDVKKVARLVSQFDSKDIIDIGCGTGYWLSFYGKNASHILLIDEAVNMLEECRKRVRKLGMTDKCDFTQGNFLTVQFGGRHFDGAVIGFVLSHVGVADEKFFFHRLDTILARHAQILIIDSVWSATRARCRNKDGMQQRTLSDGRVFSIYKRYFTLDELSKLMLQSGFEMTSSYAGEVFLAAIGVRSA